MATFTSEVTDIGCDPDGNGLFENLQVDVQVNVTEAGTFLFDAMLADASGDYIAIGSLTSDFLRSMPMTFIPLKTGIQRVSLYFQGLHIRSSGADGPYTVNISLHREGGPLLDTATFTTGEYSHLDFQGFLIELQSLSDAALNTDTIPGYNLLRVVAQINMLAAGDIRVWGQLFAGDAHLADAGDEIRLTAGTHALNVDFPGEAFSVSRLDGPYTVYLSFHDAYYSSNEEYTTAAYSHTEFQQPNAYLTGKASDAGRDSDGDGSYDELNVTAQVAALAPGDYRLQGILEDGAGGFIETTEETIAVGGTPAEVTLRFDGLRIGRHGVDGPYQVSLGLLDANGDGLDGLDYHTNAYAYTDFELPGASFTGKFADSGVDTDGDGPYDVLRIDVGVQVTDAGVYTVTGSLFASDARGYITWDRQELSLEAGAHTVSLDFDGAAIRKHGVNGPYRIVGLDLERADGGMADSIIDAYTTGAYAYTDFRPARWVFTGNFADRGEDTNGNGLYDMLTVDMEVSISETDTYYFNALLVDPNGEAILWVNDSQYLMPGLHEVSLRFDGRYIHGNGVDGPYAVEELDVYFSDQSFALQDAYTTGAYEWDAFEPSAVVSGSVTAGGKPVPRANVYIGGADTALTDDSGAYRLSGFGSGAYEIKIGAVPPSLAPWEIWVNGERVAEGASATIQVVAGQVTEVNFVSIPLSAFAPVSTSPPGAS